MPYGGSRQNPSDINKADSPTSFAGAVAVSKRQIDRGRSSPLILAVQKQTQKTIQRFPDRAHDAVTLGERVIEKAAAIAPVVLDGGDPFENVDFTVLFENHDSSELYRFNLQALIDQWIAAGLMPTVASLRG